MHRVYWVLGKQTEQLTLTGEAHHYISRVIRQGVGDRFVLFDESGEERVVEITAIDRREVQVQVLERRQNRCEPSREIWLVQGYPKGNKLFDVIRAATALGVAGIVPFQAERSVAGKGERSEGWLKRCQRIALEASRQCGRCKTPEVLEPAGSLKDALAELKQRGIEYGFCLWEEATEPLSKSLREHLSEKEEPLALVIGPEGGLTQDEANAARAAGLPFCHLGPRILRTELAPIVALSILQHHFGQLE